MKLRDLLDVITEGAKLVKIKDHSISINLNNMDVDKTRHLMDRTTRHGNTEEKKIKLEDVKTDIILGLDQIVNAVANGEMEQECDVLITNRKTNLNIVINVHLKKGKDIVTVVTVMKKPNFKPKSNTYHVFV